jgi:hypothetical protein
MHNQRLERSRKEAAHPHRYVLREMALGYRTRNLLYLVAVLSLSYLAGCATECQVCPEDLPPTACLRMGVVRYSDYCPLTVRFLVNPDCSYDDQTPYEDLEIRWDRGADGTWDTEFGPMEAHWHVGPWSVADTMWWVRCEVRDHAGQTSETVDSLDLRPLLPRPPDIIAGRLTVRLEGSAHDVDTVSVGERFSVSAYERCWMDPTEDLFLIEFQLDGEILSQGWAHVTPALGSCQSTGQGGLTIDQAGTYQIKVVFDASNVFLESNEDNNVSAKSLVVVDAAPN